MNLAILHSTIRGDEKLLIDAARKDKSINLTLVDIRELLLDPNKKDWDFDVVLERSISATLATHATNYFESLGYKVVNGSEIATICNDKFLTSLRLAQNGVKTVPFATAFNEKEAIEAVEKLGGFPVVIKPPMGSWGRLIAKINDTDALEALIEQKLTLGGPAHHALYFQKFIPKPDRDIRVVVAGDDVICAIYRETKHWVTNTARGAQAKPCKVDKELKEISLAAAKAVGGGVLGIDVFETDEGYTINEVNRTTEFKNVQRVTGVDVAARILKYCKKVAK